MTFKPKKTPPPQHLISLLRTQIMRRSEAVALNQNQGVYLDEGEGKLPRAKQLCGKGIKKKNYQKKSDTMGLTEVRGAQLFHRLRIQARKSGHVRRSSWNVFLKNHTKRPTKTVKIIETEQKNE